MTADDAELAVSVVLCTHQRPRSLRSTLAVYEKIATSAAWELIVVDSSNDDQTQQVIDEQQSSGRLPLISIRLPGAGLSLARNVGALRGRGRIICFSDDDCLPGSDFVDAWIKAFASGKLDFAGGRIELFDPSDIAMTIKTDLEPTDYAPRQVIFPGEVQGANMAFRRQVIIDMGGFDLDFGPASPMKGAEDIVGAQAASACGFCGGYRSEPVVWHHHGRKEKDRAPLIELYTVTSASFSAWLVLTYPSIVIADVWRRSGSVPSRLLFLKQAYWALRRIPWRYRRMYLRGAARFMTIGPRRVVLRQRHRGIRR